MDLVIGIGDYAISAQVEDQLKTFALASCVALTVYSPLRQVAGMIHIALPSPSGIEEVKHRPYYYATQGIPLMINKLCGVYGCRKTELVIRMYGGANSIRDDDYFRIGFRNIRAVYKILEEMNLRISEEQTGGTESRSLVMDVFTGTVRVSKQPLRLI